MTIPSETGALGILWMLRLDKPLPGSPEPRIPATFSRAGPEMAEELAQAMGLDNSAPVLQRFGMGRHCYIARVEGNLAAYGWITFDEEGIGELGLRIRLKKGEAYIWDCATLPAYRGLRLYPALLAHMLVDLQSAGFQRVWIGTDADNLPSQSGVVRVGFQPIAEVIRAPDGRFSSRGRPGVPLPDVLDAHYALFGNRDTTRVVLPET
jgi:ribosomal protein S18 acetylase RimI-like enzyme